MLAAAKRIRSKLLRSLGELIAALTCKPVFRSRAKKARRKELRRRNRSFPFVEPFGTGRKAISSLPARRTRPASVERRGLGRDGRSLGKWLCDSSRFRRCYARCEDRQLQTHDNCYGLSPGRDTDGEPQLELPRYPISRPAGRRTHRRTIPRSRRVHPGPGSARNSRRRSGPCRCRSRY